MNNKLKEVNVKFILTVDDDLFHSKLTEEARESIINVGRVDISKCPQLYYESDALFLPTLLECSTANYPEAMKMERPILTSNLSFATKVCEDAAYYFDPMDVDDIVDKLVFFINSQELRTELVMNGKKQLNTFFTSEQRANKYLKICELISKK
nr:glycosyltransferase [uncultured Marinifilum sp.]